MNEMSPEEERRLQEAQLPELKEDPKAVAVREAREKVSQATKKYQEALAEMITAEDELNDAIEELHRPPEDSNE